MNNEEKILSMLQEMREELTSVSAKQDAIQAQQSAALAEGHTVIQEQIKNLSVIDRMQDDIVTLKAAVKYLSGEVERMKAI